jgi:hypothetical protein
MKSVAMRGLGCRYIPNLIIAYVVQVTATEQCGAAPGDQNGWMDSGGQG